MIKTNTIQNNFVVYLIVEIIVMALITFLASAFIFFYAVGRGSSRSEDHHTLEYIMSHPTPWIVVGCLTVIPTLFIVVGRRRGNFIVGFDFNNSTQSLRLISRKFFSKKLSEVDIPFSLLEFEKASGKKFFFVERDEMYQLKNQEQPKTQYLFMTNNFIWEERGRQKRFFIEQLKLHGTNLKSINNKHQKT